MRASNQNNHKTCLHYNSENLSYCKYCGALLSNQVKHNKL